MTKKQTLAKYACYAVNLSMSAVTNLSALLFMTFHRLYDISYTQLGLLVLVNFCTQLLVDLLFSFFSHRLPLKATVRLTPLLTICGLLVYGILPTVFPQNAYLFLLLGTMIFAASAGLVEVLISPVIAALPSDNPQRDMSRVHSVYAWGVVLVVLVSTLYLQFAEQSAWFVLPLFWTILPLTAFVLFLLSQLPPLEGEKRDGKTAHSDGKGKLAACFLCIFLGGAAENTMGQWCSGYLETALGLPKLWGDVGGMAMFAAMLGLGRSLYARFGKKIDTVLFFGFLGAFCCYLTAALTQNALVGLCACALTGFCVSMLWPGTLIYMAQLLPSAGVAAYALMAAGGDFGGSVVPQLVGSITDRVAQHSDWATSLALVPDQLGLKAGLLTASFFPLAGVLLLILMKKRRSRKKTPAQ